MDHLTVAAAATDKSLDARCCQPITLDGILRVHPRALERVDEGTYGGLMGGLGQQAHVVDDATLNDEDKRD
jgi:hypothetical protein